MSLKDKINKLLGEDTKKEIKTLLAKFADVPAATPPATPPVAPPAPAADANSVQLQDGTSLTSTAPIAVGSSVQLVTPSGAAVAPDGEYVGMDGTNYTVVGGVVTEIETAQAEAVEPDMAPLMAAIKKEVDAVDKRYAARFEAMEKENAALKTEVEAHKQSIKVTLGAIDKITSIPVEDPIERPSNWDSMTTLEKRRYNKQNEK